MTFIHFLLIGIGAFLAGIVNALAGGGTLITFPLLTAVGIPPVVANVTNTLALCPGYFGATFAQRRDLTVQKRRLFYLIPAGILGGFVGAMLLLKTGERQFTRLIPWLILLASLLLALGEPIKKVLAKKHVNESSSSVGGSALGIAAASVYGGYFGAGLSVIILAVLGISYDDSLTHLNALKQSIALAANVAAAVVFAISGRVIWSAALVMAVCALAGGATGGRLAGKMNPVYLRWLVVAIGVIVSILYFFKTAG